MGSPALEAVVWFGAGGIVGLFVGVGTTTSGAPNCRTTSVDGVSYLLAPGAAEQREEIRLGSEHKLEDGHLLGKGSPHLQA